MLQTAQSFKLYRRQIIFLIVAGLTGSVEVGRCQNMVNTLKHFKSFVEWWGDLGPGIGIVEDSPEGGPYVSHQGGTQIVGSQPVPVQHQGQIQIAYLIYTYLNFPRPRRVFPPKKVEWFNPVSGMPTDKVPVTPAYFGQKDDPSKPLKGLIKLPNITVETQGELRDRLLALYDVLFPIWATNPSTLNQTGLQSQAREFLKIFDQVYEPPLLPYYKALGRDWLEWLRKLAQ